MDSDLKGLCSAIKNILSDLKPEQNPLSFLVITSITSEGKTALLSQSSLQHFPVDFEDRVHIYYNKHGIIIELGEVWVTHNAHLMAYSLKKINEAHPAVRISGLVLCIDGPGLLSLDSEILLERCKQHVALAARFPKALGYPLPLALVISKLDMLAGFNAFFLSDHETEWLKPLGFSLGIYEDRKKHINQLIEQFDSLLENIGDQVIRKLHPVRSTIKRSLIREFPIQMASLRVPVQVIAQAIPRDILRLEAIYFISARQSGVSYDGLNPKINHEYALTLPHVMAQPSQDQSCFIDGAIKNFQRQTKQHVLKMSSLQKWISGSLAGCGIVFLLIVAYQHIRTADVLDAVSREMLSYELLSGQNDFKNNALYHLIKAESTLDAKPKTILWYPQIQLFQKQVHNFNRYYLRNAFLPKFMEHIESILQDTSVSVSEKFDALSIYLMLGSREHFKKEAIVAWFQRHGMEKNVQKSSLGQVRLLEKALQSPFQPVTLNQDIIRDTRNYLNALPSGYLYYQLAKGFLSKEKMPLDFEGFDLAYRDIPVIFTKSGFHEVVQQLPGIGKKLQQDHWVLARNESIDIVQPIQEAYYIEYVYWWQNFIRRTMPEHYQGYGQAQKLMTILYTSHAISKLIHFIQSETSPMPDARYRLFNHKIAAKLTTVNLLSDTAIQGLEATIQELGRFITTVALVRDNGKTVFEITKSRFSGKKNIDPLSVLYAQSRQLPEPASNWSKQLADDTWFIFIYESKHYLNEQWAKVYTRYQQSIADRFPFDANAQEDVDLDSFDAFFAPKGTLSVFINETLKPFLDTNKPEWQAKSVDGYAMPFSDEVLTELIRANIIRNMFYAHQQIQSSIDFSLQKIQLDPVIASLKMTVGDARLYDDQNSESDTAFHWPAQNASLEIKSMDGAVFSLHEQGVWAFFKLLKKINILADEENSANLQLLFDVNGNAGRYALVSQNQINPFSPGILTGFTLPERITT